MSGPRSPRQDRAPGQRLVAGAVAWLASAIGVMLLCDCAETDPCRTACARVAACKTRATEGDPLLGDRPPPPDKACLERCQNHPDDFAVCEGKKRTCAELRDCRGAWR